MSKNQQNQKIRIKTSSSTLILIIAIIMAISTIGIYAWARLREKASGTATAQVARWSFKVVDGKAETSDVIDFAVTRTDENPNVEEGNLAPGTYGEFEIGIDARGTETILEYDIEVDLTNKPTNMKMYSDSQKTVEMVVEDNKLVLEGFMSLEDIEEIRVEKIYWEWPFQTGETEEEQLENDLIDTEFLGKTMTMEIAVTGFEVLEAPIYLADVVQVGDYVNYDASSNGVKTFTSGDCLAGTSISGTISTQDSFNSNAPAQWRVLSVDKETGVVELMATDPTAQKVTLSEINGLVNAETILNKIGEIYGKGKGATGGRSIALEDVEQYSSYDKTTYRNANGFKYGDTNTYLIQYANEILSGSEVAKLTEGENNPATVTQTYYDYTAKSYFENLTIYNMMFKNSTDTNIDKTTYWLASRCTYLENNNCIFYMRDIRKGQVYGYGLVYSNNYALSYGYAATPVVTLQTNIKTTGQDESGVWQLKLD